VRFYLRTGQGSGVSVGIVGALILLIVMAALWFWVAAIVAAVVVLALLVRAVIAIFTRGKP
jgi:hypothetical protein